MVNYNYLVWIGVCVFCLGLFVVIRGVFGVKDKLLLAIDSAEINYKNKLPIIPRNQRNPKSMTEGIQFSRIVSAASSPNDSDNIDPNKISREISQTEQVDDKQNNHQATTALVQTELIDNLESESDIFDIDIPPMGHSDRFHGEASMIDACLRHQNQEINEDNQVLFGQKQTLTIIISPRSGELISGTKIIAIAREYGMKYGVLNMFHRYENPEGSGMLWFSMLGVSVDGIRSFDLLDLPQMAYRGLVLFLALPHPQAVRGFDSMVQVAKTIAIEMDADVHDESDYIIDDKKFSQMRHYAAEYKG